MTNQKTKAIVFIQWFGMAVLAFTFIRSLLSPITSIFYSIIISTVRSPYVDSLSAFWRELEVYYDLYMQHYTSGGSFWHLLGQMVINVFSLLPLVLLLVYFFALYHKKRHSVLLPLVLIAEAGWCVFAAGMSLYVLIRNYSQTPSIVLGVSLLEKLQYIILSQRSLFLNISMSCLSMGVYVVLAIDCFTKFRLRKLSIAVIFAYVVIRLLSPLGELLIPLVIACLLECFTQPIVYVISDILESIGTYLLELDLPELLKGLFHLLNGYGPLLLGLMKPITYLLFWICGAKRLPQEKAPVPTAEEITEEAVEVTADKEEIMSHPIYLIASDLHGSAYYTDELVEAFHREGADRLLLLGDILYHGPRNALPMGYDPKKVIDLLNPLADKITCVRGNCDSEVDQMVLNFPLMADYDTLMVGEQRLVLTHGHLFDTPKAPPVQEGDIVLQGHTHVPVCEHRPGGWWLLNPGSVSIPKEDSPHSYLLLKNGTFYWKSLLGETYRTAPLFE